MQGRLLSWIGMLYCPRARGNLPSKSRTKPSQHGKTTNNFKWYPQTERSHPFRGILTVTHPFPHFQFSPDGISNNSKTPSNTTQKSPSSNRSRGVSLRTTPWRLSTINPQQVLNLQFLYSFSNWSILEKHPFLV